MLNGYGLDLSEDWNNLSYLESYEMSVVRDNVFYSINSYIFLSVGNVEGVQFWTE